VNKLVRRECSDAHIMQPKVTLVKPKKTTPGGRVHSNFLGDLGQSQARDSCGLTGLVTVPKNGKRSVLRETVFHGYVFESETLSLRHAPRRGKCGKGSPSNGYRFSWGRIRGSRRTAAGRCQQHDCDQQREDECMTASCNGLVQHSDLPSLPRNRPQWPVSPASFNSQHRPARRWRYR
jgi:hypothetical protein